MNSLSRNLALCIVFTIELMIIHFAFAADVVSEETAQMKQTLNAKTEESDVLVQRAAKLLTEGKTSEAIELYKKAAKMLNPEALYFLGICYLDGLHGIKEDADFGVHNLNGAVSIGKHPKAAYRVANYYLNLKGSEFLANQYLLIAAKAGNIDAQYMLGTRYLNIGTQEDAVQFLAMAADQGHIEAQAIIEKLNAVSKNPNAVPNAPEDKKELVKYIDEAIDHYNNSNYDVAFKMFYKAAEQRSDEVAQYCLFRCYAWGHGVDKDDSRARYFLEKSAENGYGDAQYDMGIGLWLAWFGFKNNENESFKWFLRAAEQGHQNARYRVGMAYMVGIGVKEDLVKARDWLELAAEQGDDDAQYELGKLYLFAAENSTNSSAKKDYLLMSARYIIMAAKQGHEEAIKVAEGLQRMIE